jgi:DNA repair protein RAD57
MTDLIDVLPNFDSSPYSHLLLSLEKALITTNDLVTLEPQDIAKRAQLPQADVRKLVDAAVLALHRSLGFGAEEVVGVEHERLCISTLDEHLDTALSGGIRAGYLVEVTGER